MDPASPEGRRFLGTVDVLTSSTALLELHDKAGVPVDEAADWCAWAVGVLRGGDEVTVTLGAARQGRLAGAARPLPGRLTPRVRRRCVADGMLAGEAVWLEAYGFPVRTIRPAFVHGRVFISAPSPWSGRRRTGCRRRGPVPAGGQGGAGVPAPGRRRRRGGAGATVAGRGPALVRRRAPGVAGPQRRARRRLDVAGVVGRRAGRRTCGRCGRTAERRLPGPLPAPWLRPHPDRDVPRAGAGVGPRPGGRPPACSPVPRRCPPGPRRCPTPAS